MKQRNHKRPRLLAWFLCLAMVFSMLPVTALAADEYEEITSGIWELGNGDWATKYGNLKATYTDGNLSAAITKPQSYDAAHELKSPVLDSALENVEAIDITISFEHSTGSSGDVCLQLDAVDGDGTNTSGGWGKVNGSNPTVSATVQTFRFVRSETSPTSLKQLVLYFYSGEYWDGEFAGTAKISSIKVYKTKTTTPDPGGKGEMTLGTEKYTFTKDTFGKAGWPAQNAPTLNSAGEIELTGSSLTTGDGGWGNFADNGLHVIEWPKASNSSLNLNSYDQAELTVIYPAGAQNTDQAKLAVEINTGKKSNTQLATLNSSGGSAKLSFELAAIENTDNQTDTPLTIRVLANGSGTNTNTALFASSYTIKLSGIKFSKSTPPASNFTITAKTTIPNVADEQVWFKAFESTAITKGEQTIQLAVNPGDGGAFHADSVKAQKEDGTDVSTAVSLSFDKANDKVTLNTTGVDYNIVLVVNYGWVNNPTPVDPNANTIKSVFIGGSERQDYENKEAMDPYKADYAPGDKPVFKVATTLWGGFPLDKITASLTADGTDITGKLTIEDGESGFKKVTIDTTGLSGSIELLATYSSSWSSGGGGGGGGGSLPTITQNPNGGKGTNTSVVAAGTLVSAVRAETKGGVLTMEVTPETVKELIAQVKDNPSNTDLITIQPKFHTSGSASALVIQSADLDTLSNKTTAGLKSEGPVADITISHETVEKLAKRGDEVSINARRESQNTYSVSISSGGQKLNDLPMYVDIHTTCGFYTQAYLVKDSGETELIRWAIADQSGRTMRVFLPGAATVKFETNPPVNFMDMPQDSWGTGPVAFVASRGIFSGYDDGYFHPNTPMNRAMLVQILYGFEGKPDSGTAQFGDVKPTDWYAQAVGWAAEKGITKGCGNGQFGVSSIVSRQDAICFIYRWMGSPKANEGVLDRYSDAGSISPYARQAIAWALENDILTGDTASIISPTAQVTRYQAAKLITDLVQSQTVWNGSGKEG